MWWHLLWLCFLLTFYIHTASSLREAAFSLPFGYTALLIIESSHMSLSSPQNLLWPALPQCTRVESHGTDRFPVAHCGHKCRPEPGSLHVSPGKQLERSSCRGHVSHAQNSARVPFIFLVVKTVFKNCLEIV